MPEQLVMIADVDVGRPDATRTHTLELARGLAREGFEIELVARGPDPEIAGVRFHSAGPPRPSRLRRLVAINWSAVRVLWTRRRRAHTCYVRHYWGQIPSVLAARALHYRVVTQVDDMPYGPGYEGRRPGPRAWLADRIRRRTAASMVRAAAAIVAVTDNLKALLVRDYAARPDQVVVLPNGVDVELFRPLDRAAALRASALDPGARYAIFTGLFAEWVDFDTLLGAFARVAAERPEARLLLVGDGAERPRVESLVDKLGIREQVVLIGFVREPERVATLLGAATVCLVANRPEHRARIGVSPVKLAEYLAAGRAVVADAMPGVEDVVGGGGAGIVFPVEDVDAAAEALGSLLDDQQRADELGRAGRRLAEERYSWQSIAEQTARLLRNGT
ncbi:MAG: glycosyltransferase [Gaiellaceae bacterium]